ncbi:hypothetical protein C8Q70DRAFT_1043392 [Cubamyces menziesii]|nr:hypothetical protein C8Q70DRAFT_1043392 [Cubamyces menziesii]
MSNGDKAESARRIITRVVNSLSAAREIGGPAVCSYLLGYPDHYTNCRFKVFFWYSYVKHVLHDVGSTLLTHDDQDEDLFLTRNHKSVVGVTKVHDYIYRPCEFEHWSLYDYLRSVVINVDVDEPDLQGINDEDSEHSNMPQVDDKHIYQFQDGHPLHSTHAVVLLPEHARFILNFTGGNLPRKDRGDREFYCATMLTLFAPRGWRRGQDLLSNHGDWSRAFDAVQFPDEYVKVMNNMNVLYECADARDDYSLLRRNGQFTVDLPSINRERVDHTLPDHDDTTFDQKDLLDLIEESSQNVNSAHMRRLTEIADMKRLLVQWGYDHVEVSQYRQLDDRSLEWQVKCRPIEHWKDQMSIAKQRVIETKQQRAYVIAGVSNSQESPLSDLHSNPASNVHVDAVYVTTKVELDQRCAMDRPLQDQAIVILTSVLEQFTLNEEQRRAFLIIAHKLHHRDSTQLKMYIGGMAGTGKSQVLKALTTLMERRNESHRLFVMAPTGSSACIIDGSTYHSALSLVPHCRPRSTNLLKVSEESI